MACFEYILVSQIVPFLFIQCFTYLCVTLKYTYFGNHNNCQSIHTKGPCGVTSFCPNSDVVYVSCQEERERDEVH